MTKSELYASELLICWTYILDKEFESNHPIFFIGEPRWLDTRLFTPLIRNTCMFFFIISKVLSELVNPINVTNQTFVMKHRLSPQDEESQDLQ